MCNLKLTCFALWQGYFTLWLGYITLWLGYFTLWLGYFTLWLGYFTLWLGFVTLWLRYPLPCGWGSLPCGWDCSPYGRDVLPCVHPHPLFGCSISLYTLPKHPCMQCLPMQLPTSAMYVYYNELLFIAILHCVLFNA